MCAPSGWSRQLFWWRVRCLATFCAEPVAAAVSASGAWLSCDENTRECPCCSMRHTVGSIRKDGGVIPLEASPSKLATECPSKPNYTLEDLSPSFLTTYEIADNLKSRSGESEISLSNRFAIAAIDIERGASVRAKVLSTSSYAYEREGCGNRRGMQHFGASISTHASIGLALLQSDWKRATSLIL
ncbi:hypothetical protein BS47DRAFT_1490483 [Hydnum rufescens UP504]|uniref:TRUD domain-containing protein n=1 Tax=Hydnum rufescens UP504 TaxID=1448309 RepID=A0A9P6AD76_9AGAM|nr:hypothetical protein BS47DRAFT_1490483 [Hydnum rufescens UP504]